MKKVRIKSELIYRVNEDNPEEFLGPYQTVPERKDKEVADKRFLTKYKTVVVPRSLSVKPVRDKLRKKYSVDNGNQEVFFQ